MPDNRQIRVFISSTFRDMKRERDLLVKKVFPALRQKCAARYVAFNEVDLRWGITDEQAAEGKVLPVCLAEIEHCRPYFIGLGNKDGMQRSLGNQALILMVRGDLGGSMALHKQKEQICRELGNKNGLAISLINQALLLADKTSQPAAALPLAEEAYRLASGHGYITLVAQIKPILESLRRSAESGMTGDGSVAGDGSTQPPPTQCEPSISDLRAMASNALTRQLWEAAETYLERLLKMGEPVETIASNLVTALLNAHHALTPQAITRIESLLAQLEAGGHAALASPLRERLTAKLAASQPKKSRWKLW